MAHHHFSILSQLFDHTSSRQEFLDSVVKHLRNLTGFECVGIRVLNAGGSLPFESFTGFSQDFWTSENFLCIEDDCVCTRALRALPHPQDRSILTENGSVWTNDLQAFSRSIPETVKGQYRGKCIESGFHTLAVVPLKCNQQVIGLIHLADTRPRMLTEERVLLLESLTNAIGAVILRFNAEEELRSAKQAAEEASRAKSDFLAMMSHEIRTPMTVFMAAVEHLLQVEDNPEHRQMLQMADHSADRLHAIIENILDFSRIEARRLDLELEAFNLPDCILDVVRMMRIKAQEKDLTLEVDIHPETPFRIIGDPDRLSQILTNLIGNAVKFTREGGIRVSVQPQREVLEFEVSDTGIGIPLGKEEIIFQGFTQADNSLTRKFGGSGLGLSISKGLVQLMGGEMGVRNGDGRGATFFFTLPLQAANGIPRPPSTEEAPPKDLSDLRILIAEDEALTRDVLVRALHQRGIEAQTARDGEGALQKWRDGGIDLILMDVQMPVMNGLEATRKIREEETGRSTRIIGLTAHALLHIQQECLSAGMDAVVTKPVRMQDLFAVLERNMPRANGDGRAAV